jgi:hypothetical protein
MTKVIEDKGLENLGQESSIMKKARSKEKTRKRKWGRKMKHCLG